MAELSDREFRLLGKVVRSMPKSDESVDLLRGTTLSVFGNILEQLISGFQTGMKSQNKLFDSNLIEETTIKAPVLEIVPIAIYV